MDTTNEPILPLWALLALGAGAIFLFMRRANAQDYEPLPLPDASPDPIENPLVQAREQLKAGILPNTVPSAKPTPAANVVPLRKPGTLPTQNPFKADPNAPGAAKAYRFNGVNYWLAKAPDGSLYYMNDAELTQYRAKKV